MILLRFLLAFLCLSTGISSFGALRPQGGTFTWNITPEPTTLNPISSVDVSAQNIQAFVVEGLLQQDPDTYEFYEGLADKWEISKDGKVFTFHLRDGAKFSDGTPVTVEDVKFSFDLIFDPKYNAAPKRSYLENIEKCEIVDPRTVRFIAKEKYHQNFDVVAGGIVRILPQSVYKDPKASGLNKKIVGSGPYRIASYEQGKRIVLEKNPNWWGRDLSQKKGEYNFDKLIIRFIGDDNIALETLKKGEIDFKDLKPEDFVKKAVGPEWGKKIIKVKTENSGPKSYGFIAWNLQNPILKDKNVRIALAHLLNRKLMNEKFRFGMSEPATGPWYAKSEYASPRVKAIEYNPKKALEMLKAAGWSDADKTGTLTKVIDGKKTPLSLTIMNAKPESMKYFTMYKEDAKQVGVQFDLKLVEWNTFIKLMDENKFDAVALGWGGGSVNIDPKQIFHSASDVKGGSNFNHYRNEEVDKLIMEARGIFDKKKRIPILQKVYELIAADAPYAFLFYDRYDLYAHTSRIKKPKDTFKYEIGTSYWWTTN